MRAKWRPARDPLKNSSLKAGGPYSLGGCEPGKKNLQQKWFVYGFL
jgi:hypothetical protein